MSESFETGMAALARFIEEKEILLCWKNGKHIPMKLSSIQVELSREWTALQAARGIKREKKKKSNNK